MTTEPAPIRVSCPECHVPYLLPARLLGPGGARVRCPGCGSSFDVAPPAATADVLTKPAASATGPVSGAETGPAPGFETVPATGFGTLPPQETATDPAPGPPEGDAAAADSLPASVSSDSAPPAREVAREVLDALARHVGPDLERVVAEGRVFARFGPEIFAAYDEYRRRAKEGGADPFRIALRDRFGVDLPEVTPRS